MTDDEINRRVAEIKGYRSQYETGEFRWVREINDPIWYPSSHGFDLGSDAPPPYATDWQWCGPLVEKYKVEMVRNVPVDLWAAFVHSDSGRDSSPQRAICLAVIAAHAK